MSFGQQKAKLRRHAPCTHLPRLPRSPCVAGDVSAPSRPCDRKPCFEAASDGAEERAAPPTARRRRSSFLGRTPKIVARVGESPAHRQRGYSSPVASGSVQAILGDDFPTPASRTTSRRRRDPSPHPAYDARRLVVHGAPRIHAELTKLGFIISEKTVSRYMPRLPAEPDQVKR